MAIPLVNVLGKITASTMNAIIKQVNATALNGIVPTSVSGTGVTVTPNGQVTYINSPSVSLDGVFSGTYDNYRITWNSTNRSSSAATQIRLRAAGTDNTVNYSWVENISAGTTVTVASSSSGSMAPIDFGVASGQYSSGTIDIFGPALSQSTTATIVGSVLSGGNPTLSVMSFMQRDSTTFDGFTMFPFTSGATWSGIVRVYGYNTLT